MVKKPSRTASALELVESGETVGKAAKHYGITPQSVYRLRKYRSGLEMCPQCGRAIKAKK